MGALVRNENIQLISARIKPQFPNNVYGTLMFRIVLQAVTDVFGNKIEAIHRCDGRRYLRGRMIHAEWCGVDSDWIRESIIKIIGEDAKHAINAID